MPSNKKPRKARRRPQISQQEQAQRHPVFGATRRHAISSDDKLVLALLARDSLENVRLGRHTNDDIQALATLSNVAMILCELGFGPEYLPDTQAAQDVLVKAEAANLAEAQRTGAYDPRAFKLDAAGFTTMVTLIELFEQQAELATAADMARALQTMQDRIDAKAHAVVVRPPAG